MGLTFFQPEQGHTAGFWCAFQLRLPQQSGMAAHTHLHGISKHALATGQLCRMYGRHREGNEKHQNARRRVILPNWKHAGMICGACAKVMYMQTLCNAQASCCNLSTRGTARMMWRMQTPGRSFE